MSYIKGSKVGKCPIESNKFIIFFSFGGVSQIIGKSFLVNKKIDLILF